MKLRDYDLLYDLPAGEYDGHGIDGVRTVTIRAGMGLEVMCCPIIKTGPDVKAEIRRRKTTPAMQKVNDRNRERKMMRLLDHNYTPAAVVFTGTYAYPSGDYGFMNLKELIDLYDDRGLPWDADRVKKDVRNFREKLKRLVVKAGGRAEDFKWIIRIEEGKQPPAEGLPPKYHIHAIFEGPGITREAVEALWPHGLTDAKNFDLKGDGAHRLAQYLNKQKQSGRWWSHSRNLKQPPRTVSERKVSRRRLAMIAADVYHDGRGIMEKLYPGYRLMECTVHYSDYVAGAYIYARMRRRD